MADSPARARIALILRAEAPAVRARLVGAWRDFDLAEDALQEALGAACEHWPDDGEPDAPDVHPQPDRPHRARNSSVVLTRG